MRFLSYSLACFAFCGPALFAQPVINPGGVLNNSSSTIDGLPNSGIAQGSIFAIYGQGLGPAQLQQGAFPLQNSFAGTSVNVTVNGTSVSALIIYTSALQVAALLPSRTPVGIGTITLTYNGLVSPPVAIKVVASAFGISTLNGAGAGPAVAQNFVSGNTTLAVNTVLAPAKPGQTVILYGTGLGPVNFDETKPAQQSLVGSSAAELYVGGQLVTAAYSGRSPCCAGLDQINFVVPNVDGCAVPVGVLAGGVISNFASIAVSSSGQACGDPTGLPASDVGTIQSKGSARFGSVVMERTVYKAQTVDTATAGFFQYNADQAARSSTFALPSLGSCKLIPPGSNSLQPAPLGPVGLDAGQYIVISAPGGQRTLSPFTADKGLYVNPAQDTFLNPGQYFLNNGGGGKDVGPFSTTFMVPSGLVWTNQTSIASVDRSKDLVITWTGGDPGGFVEVTGASTAFAPLPSSSTVSASFLCVASTSAGQLTVPSIVLQGLPATPVNSTLAGSLTVGSFNSPFRFSAAGLDAAYELTGIFAGTATVPYQ